MRAKFALLAALLSTMPVRAAAPGAVDLLVQYRSTRGRVADAEKALAGNRRNEARRILEECLTKVPDHYGVHFLLAKMDFEDRNYRGALVHIGIAERALGDLGEAYQKDLELMERQDGLEEMQLQSQANTVQAGKAGTNGCGGAMLSDTGTRIAFLAAKKNWEADSANPYRVPPLYHLIHADCLAMLGRDQEAIPHYHQAVKEDPALAAAWHNLIFLLMKEGNTVGAKEALLQADAAKATVDPALRKALVQAN